MKYGMVMLGILAMATAAYGYAGSPYSGSAIVISDSAAATFTAGAFDFGGQNVAYYEMNPGENDGAHYGSTWDRPDAPGVDLGDNWGNKYAGFYRDDGGTVGEWYNYSVNTVDRGYYTMNVSCRETAGNTWGRNSFSISLSKDGGDTWYFTSPIAYLPAGCDFSTAVSVPDIDVQPGTNLVKMNIVNDIYVFQSFTLVYDRVPEPATALLLLAGLPMLRRRRV